MTHSPPFGPRVRRGVAHRAIAAACIGMVTVLATAVSCADAEPAPDVAPEATRPHVVVVIIDTLRADRCGFLGYERNTTPELSRLAAEFEVYETCWSPAPWTAPAHGSLFTGLRPDRHGLRRATGDRLVTDHDTLAETLTDAGYRAHAITSNPNVQFKTGLLRGFDSTETLYRSATRHFRVESNIEGATPRTQPMLHLEHSPAGEAMRRAVARLDAAETDGQPAFVFLNVMEPHLTYEPTEEHAASLVRPADPVDLAWAREFRFPACTGVAFGCVDVSPERWRVLSDLYDAEIAAADAAVGQLVEDLRERDLLDRTLIVITSDHGELLGEHGLADHQFDLHAQLLRVPLLVRRPHGSPRRVRDLVRLEDVTPTVLQVVGLPIPDGLDGVELSRDLPGRLSRGAFDPPRNSPAHAAQIYGLPRVPQRCLLSFRSVTDGRWHLIRDSEGREELFDLSIDPAETRNVLPSERQVADRLRPLLPPFEASPAPR